MYGISRNNVAESAANLSKVKNIRTSIPPIAMALWINNSKKMVYDYYKQIKRVNTENIPYTYMGARCMSQNRERLENSRIKNVIQTENMTTLIIREKSGKSKQNRKVMHLKNEFIKCSCTYYNQYEMLCPHILCGMQYLKHMNLLKTNDNEMLMSKLMHNFYQSMN